MKLINAVVAGACLASLALAQQTPASAPRVKVCDLLSEPDRYNGKRVEIRAQTSASEEGAVIFDQHCSGSILFANSDNSSASRRLERLMKSHSSASATLVGVFEHAAARRFGHQGMWDSRFLANSVSEVRADELGWLVGTAAIFGDRGFQADAAKAAVIVTCKDQRTTISADEHGDYGVLLEPCQYQLLDVIGPDGKKLEIHARQVRTFVIKRGGRTRFDLMIKR